MFVTFITYFLLGQEGQGKPFISFIHCSGGRGVCLDFCFYWARRARGSLLLALFIVQGEGVCALFCFFFNSFTVEGEGGGVQVYVFFL